MLAKSNGSSADGSSFAASSAPRCWLLCTRCWLIPPPPHTDTRELARDAWVADCDGYVCSAERFSRELIFSPGGVDEETAGASSPQMSEVTASSEPLWLAIAHLNGSTSI